ncbi:MAG: hypothetical protein IKS22_00670 [Bacteroidales bacterium]|nr:hypothetical protein [Bacteroidales bacterium]
MDKYNEEDFYSDNGWPPEEYAYCRYVFPVVSESGSDDYDQFVLITNALYPYIRLTKKRGDNHFPCGREVSPSTDGSFARSTVQERDGSCPKIAWGFIAFFINQLIYDGIQNDYVLQKDLHGVMATYYGEHLKYYLQNHNGLRYSNLSKEQKEQSFVEEHLSIERGLWEKSSPLKSYTLLYEYAKKAEFDYEDYLCKRKLVLKRMLTKTNNHFSTEVRGTFGKTYIKVFFLDDSVASEAKTIVEGIPCVKKVNITQSTSISHSGNTLTVYQKPMVDDQTCKNEVETALNQFFANVKKGNMHPHNEANFAGIEKRILSALDQALASIDVCVAWFTNPVLRDKLLGMRKKGIKVRVIRYKDKINDSRGVDLTGLDFKEVKAERGGVFHDKFCVIDNVTTISGSYNWTQNAEHNNDEDASFQFEDVRFASEYTKRFNQIWEREDK